MEIEHTLKVRIWGTAAPEDDYWHVPEFERIAGMIEEGYHSGEVIVEGTSGGWWSISSEEAEDALPSAPDAAPAAPQTSEALAALENAEAFILDCPASAHRDAVLRDVRGAISSAPQTPDASALMLAALREAQGVISDLSHQCGQMRGMFSDDDGEIARAIEEGEAAFASIAAAIAAAEGREG